MYNLLILAVICFSRSSIINGAPADLNNLDNHLNNNAENIDLNQYTLPNFSAFSTEVDVNKTVEEVENILRSNPSLPRLSKQDILSLLNNITTEDRLKYQQEKSTSSSKVNTSPKIENDKDGKPVMVVLPYKPDSKTNDVKELFIKPPIVKFIPSKPIVVLDELSPLTDIQQKNLYKNHKYDKDDLKTSNQSNELQQNSFWLDQAQKVMEDLKKQNDKISPKKETKDVPFKKMPNVKFTNVFDKKNVLRSPTEEEEEEGLKLNIKFASDYENNNTPTFKKVQPLVADEFKDMLVSMGLYKEDNKPIASPITDLELVIPKEPSYQSYIRDSPVSYLTNDQNSQDSTYSYPDSSAYLEFKPLPIGDTTNIDDKQTENIDDILDKYGLLDLANKQYLPVSPINFDTEQTKSSDYITNTDFVNSDMLPADMTSMLTNLGLMKKNGRKMSDVPKKNEGDSDSSESNSALQESLETGPDPMSIEEIGSIDQAVLNMKKRQESNDTTTEEVAESTTVSSDEPKNSDNDSPAIADLESSFGASPADDDPSEANLPPPRKNGFYYMLDWNSFLEVGEGERKVNIRFDPKLGDPQRFLAVTVP